MGSATLSTLVSEGLLMAGDTRLTDRAKVWLKDWLRSQAAAFPWPVLHREKSGVALALGSQSVAFGNGSEVTPQVVKIHDPIFVYDSTFSTRQNVRIRPARSDTLDWDETINNSATNRGTPNYAKITPFVGTPGKWTVTFDRAADKAYLLKFFYLELPADPGDSAVPWYPNDRTMKKVIEVEALRYRKDPEHASALEVLAMMVTEDRVKYSSSPGINDEWGLDPKVFR